MDNPKRELSPRTIKILDFIESTFNFLTVNIYIFTSIHVYDSVKILIKTEDVQYIPHLVKMLALLFLTYWSFKKIRKIRKIRKLDEKASKIK